jgi:RNA polymerase sigma factor for flagellar operon FliA
MRNAQATLTHTEIEQSPESTPSATPFSDPQSEETAALWELFWADRSRTDIRAKIAQTYEYVIPCVIRTFGRNLKSYWEKGELHALGYIGLLQSVDSFAVASNPARFAGYATLRVRGVILDELRARDFFPRAVREDVNRVKEATERLISERGEEPTRAAIAAATGMDPSQSERVLTAMRSVYFLRLDQRIASEDSEISVSETIPTQDPGPEATAIESVNSEELVNAIKELPPRERAALSFRYFGRLTQMQIAELLGVSPSRICQIEKAALARLKTKLTPADNALRAELGSNFA